jgi:hypothetical protein
MGADSPIFKGLNHLTKQWEFNDLITITSEWRENLWNIGTKIKKYKD